jgi:hypothetical protein
MDTIDIINALAAGNKIDAMDKINDHLYAKAADSMKGYKEVLAQSYFATAEEETTVETPEVTEE